MIKFWNYLFSTILICFFIASCSSSFHNQNYEKLQGSWLIYEFEYIDENQDSIIDLTGDERYGSILFEKHNYIYFSKRENRKVKNVGATYLIFKEKDTLKIKIEKSEDERIEGIYDLYIDTIQENELQQYLIQISLDKENTYISAFRWKN